MRDPKRINRLLRLVKKVWKKYPDLRLCQLLGNLYSYAERHDLYYLEDWEVEQRIKEVYKVK